MKDSWKVRNRQQEQKTGFLIKNCLKQIGKNGCNAIENLTKNLLI